MAAFLRLGHGRGHPWIGVHVGRVGFPLLSRRSQHPSVVGDLRTQGFERRIIVHRHPVTRAGNVDLESGPPRCRQGSEA